MSGKKMKIDYLAHHPQLIPELSRIHVDFFGRYHSSMTVESREEQLRKRLGIDKIPLTIVAIEVEKPIGSASIIEYDLKTHQELTPWVAAVIVHPDYRRLGIGTKLMNRIDLEAVNIGLEKLFLFTPDQETFYSFLGWEVILKEKFQGQPIVIMEKKFSR
jgi:GNAT superfamily N-acetyltransferase